MHPITTRLPEDALVDCPTTSTATATACPPDSDLPQALQRYLNDRGMRGSTVQGLANICRYGQEFITWCASQGVRQVRQLDARLMQAYQFALHTYRQRNGQPPDHDVRRHLSPRVWVRSVTIDAQRVSCPPATLPARCAQSPTPRRIHYCREQPSDRARR